MATHVATLQTAQGENTALFLHVAMIPNSSRVPEFLIDLGKNFIWLKYEKAHATANLRQNDIGHDLPSPIHPESSG